MAKLIDNPAAPLGWRYAQRQVLHEADTISPLAGEGSVIDIRNVHPDRE